MTGLLFVLGPAAAWSASGWVDSLDDLYPCEAL